jgi:Flp pilus assembly secretin CpaC
VASLFVLAIAWAVFNAPIAAQAPAAPQQPETFPRLHLTTGRSMILTPEYDVTRIAITNPAIADATVVQPREILIDGKAPGTISLIVWGGAGQRVQYDVVVEQPVAGLEQQLRQLFPGEEIQVTMNADAIVLSGRVSSTQVMIRAAEIARAAAPKGNVINMMQVPGAIDAQQVMLQVRFAEVNRRAITELGASIFTGANGYRNWIARGTTQQFPAPDFNQAEDLVFSDFLNIFLFNTNFNMGTVIRALQQTGYFQSLAEPNLLAYIPGSVLQRRGCDRDSVPRVRCAVELHPDHRRRSDQAAGTAGGQLARLQQRHHPRGLPDSGSDNAPCGDGSGAARRPVVRDCGTHRQRVAGR